jgi:hypothetical protein
MKYDKFTFLYPPRKGGDGIEPDTLGLYERRDYGAQFKKNGTGGILAISPDKQIIARRRNGKAHLVWTPDDTTRQAFLHLPDRWYYFGAELLHSKVAKHVVNGQTRVLRHINYINEVLVADGEYLVGTTFTERQQILATMFPNAVDHISGGYKVIDANTWLAINYDSGFKALFDKIKERGLPEDEGVVLKKRSAKLAFCTSETANDSWQAKCRLPTKNFQR